MHRLPDYLGPDVRDLKHMVFIYIVLLRTKYVLTTDCPSAHSAPHMFSRMSFEESKLNKMRSLPLNSTSCPLNT